MPSIQETKVKFNLVTGNDSLEKTKLVIDGANVVVLQKDTEQLINLSSSSIGKWETRTDLQCMICWKPIANNEKNVTCYSCGNHFHEDHWNKWIGAKHACPVCKTKPRRR